MLKCREIPDRASAYIDREGTVASLGAVALHLAACSNCRRYVRGLKAVRRLAAESFRDEPPEALFGALDVGGPSDPDRRGP